MRYFETISAEVVDYHFLQALERVAKVQQGPCRLVDAWVEDQWFIQFLEVISTDNQLTVSDLDCQNLLDRDDLSLVVFLYILWNFDVEQTCINLVDVLIQAVVGIDDNESV